MALKFVNNEDQKRFDNIDPETKYIMLRRFAIAEQLHYILEEKGMTQKDFALLMNKAESEISKWMAGSHNFTIDTLSLIEFKLKTNLF
jgi:predicted transcriptional regulator